MEGKEDQASDAPYSARVSRDRTGRQQANFKTAALNHSATFPS